jgi:hypothetical protein
MPEMSWCADPFFDSHDSFLPSTLIIALTDDCTCAHHAWEGQNQQFFILGENLPGADKRWSRMWPGKEHSSHMYRQL